MLATNFLETNLDMQFLFCLKDTWLENQWGSNITEFQQRFDEVLTLGEGPRRLKNLYFIYLIELRALSKVLPYFERPSFQLFTGDTTRDAENKDLLLEILHLIRQVMWQGDNENVGKITLGTLRRERE